MVAIFLLFIFQASMSYQSGDRQRQLTEIAGDTYNINNLPNDGQVCGQHKQSRQSSLLYIYISQEICCSVHFIIVTS